MDESKDLQSLYKIFRILIYVAIFIEFFEYAINPASLNFWNGFLFDIYSRIKTWGVYQDGHMIYSKVMTLLIICVTCIGTKNKKHLEFNAKKMVIYPISFGLILMFLSVWVFKQRWSPSFFSLPLSTWIYFLMSIVGAILCQVALDNISKFLKDGLLKDRFNFENESFSQMEEKVENKYSVNIPMRYYYKGKFRKGWVNIINPFRGSQKTKRVISAKLTDELKVNVNRLNSAICRNKRKTKEKIRIGMTSGCLGTWGGELGNSFPKIPKKVCSLNGFNSIILSQMGVLE